MTPLQHLNDLFVTLFADTAALRRFLAFHAPDVRHEVPDSTLADAAFTASDMLLRRNAVTPALIRALIDLAPGRRVQIEAVARVLRVTPVDPVGLDDDVCDVLLVTVTDIETRTALDAMARATGQPATMRFGGEKTYFRCGRLGGAAVMLVRSEMGSDGVGAAVTTVRDAIAEVRPAAIVMLGLAFGVEPTRQSLGDVLISKQIQGYDLRRVGTDGKDGTPVVTMRGDRVSASPKLLDRFRTAGLTWTRARVSAGLLLSGQTLVDHVGYRDGLRALAPEAIGGEMEGAGVYAAAGRIDWILVKAICDWADGEKHVDKLARQTTAAENAAELVVAAIAQGGFARG